MTEIIYIAGGRLTKPTSGNGVPLGLNPSLLFIPAVDISGLFDPDTSPNRIHQLLDEGAGFIADEHIVDSK
jgi:hypothetical protein